MGFRQLQRDVAALQQRGQGVVRLDLEDSIVTCSFAACPAPISVVFCQPDDYDSSPVLVMCESCGKVSALLQQVSDTFEDGGALLTVLELVCQALHIGALCYAGFSLCTCAFNREHAAHHASELRRRGVAARRGGSRGGLPEHVARRQQGRH